MALLKEWYAVAYDEKANKGDIQRFWTRYFELEKGVYEQLLTNPDEEVKGSVKELAEKYDIKFLYRDFRPGFRQGQAKARQLGLYMQKYCGCVFSEEDRYLCHSKKKAKDSN